jgi:ribonuclease P protein component
MLSKPNRLKKSSNFDKVYKEGKHLKGKFGKLVYLNQEMFGSTRIGIVVPGKLAKAHKRNRMKRQIRSIFRENLKNIPQGLLISFILWDTNYNFRQIKLDIENLICQIE